MVQAMIKISDEANQILNIVKAKYDLKDKSLAIERVIMEYGGDFLEPQLRPEFIQKMRERQKEKTIKVKDFKKHFGLEQNVMKVRSKKRNNDFFSAQK